MAADLFQSMSISTSGMAAQSTRLKIISENIANADSVVTDEGSAYRRKQILFRTEVDKATGLNRVEVDRIREDRTTPLKQVHDPAHPLADEQGFVAYPNVNTFVESLDLQEASRMYEANMQAIESAKTMMARSFRPLALIGIISQNTGNKKEKV